MKHLKILLTALALGVAASVPLQAAQQKKGGMSPEQYVERVEQAVGSLTAAQKTKITNIVAKTQDDMRALPKEERKEKGASLQKKQRDEIRAVLDAEQQKKYDAMGAGGKKKKNR
jgi:Skp family chaperone for outer membrane proteins